MLKVYVSGALTNVPNQDEIKGFYEAIGKLCGAMGLEPYVPHLHTDPIKNSSITPAQVFETDKHHVTASDLVIAYVGIPSLGVGMELAYAEESNIPVILLYEEGARVSRFPRGIPTLAASIQFRDYEQALAQLKSSLQSIQNEK